MAEVSLGVAEVSLGVAVSLDAVDNLDAAEASRLGAAVVVEVEIARTSVVKKQAQRRLCLLRYDR